MQAQIRLGRIFGIEIGLHYSWLIIPVLIATSLSGHFSEAHPGRLRGPLFQQSLLRGAGGVGVVGQ